MTNENKLEVFQAQTKNVRFLEKVWNSLNRSVNAAYLRNKAIDVEISVKLLVQVYCALAEAIFSKTIHTPDGLSFLEIEEIKNIAAKCGISLGWKKCFDLAIIKIDDTICSTSHKNELKSKMHSLIDKYVFEPHSFRNKIAHGQWIVALNAQNTKVNEGMTSQIEKLDIIALYKYKQALLSVSTILQDLIVSPNNAHLRFYESSIDEFEKTQNELASYTIQNKILSLKTKSIKK